MKTIFSVYFLIAKSIWVIIFAFNLNKYPFDFAVFFLIYLREINEFDKFNVFVFNYFMYHHFIYFNYLTIDTLSLGVYISLLLYTNIKYFYRIICNNISLWVNYFISKLKYLFTIWYGSKNVCDVFSLDFFLAHNIYGCILHKATSIKSRPHKQ